MTSEVREQLGRAVPELDRIEDEAVRAGVLRAWETAAAEAGVDDLAAVPWLPPEQARLDLPDERLLPHVRDVTAASVALAASLRETRPHAVEVSMDVVLAGALVHDVSKLYEYDGTDETPVGRLLGHPHFGVHVAAAAGLPLAVQHVVLSHSPRSAAEPATLEAEIVARADAAAVAAIRQRAAPERRGP